MRVIGLAALIVIAFAIACGEPESKSPSSTTTLAPTATTWNCQELLPQILELNRKKVVEDPRRATVLLAYEVEETNRTEDRLDCSVLANTSQGSDKWRLDFHTEQNRGGNQLLGYRLGPVVTPTPSATNTPTSTPTQQPAPTPTATNTPASTPTQQPATTPTATSTVTPGPTSMPGDILWRYGRGWQRISPPSVAGGIVYVGIEGSLGGLHALDATTGEIRWKFETEVSIGSSPTASNDIVYFGSGDQHLYALDATTGNLLWRYKTSDGVYSSPAVANGVVYFGSSDTYFYAVDAVTGDLQWRYETEYSVGSSPAVADGIVYFASSDDGDLYALNADTGALRWKYESASSYGSNSPTVSDGVAYIHSNGMNALAADTGQLLWKYEVQPSLSSTPAVANGVVYSGSTDRYMYALDAATGELLWRYKTGNRYFSSPEVADGILYFGSGDDYWYALDASSGELIWRHETEEEDHLVRSSPTVAHGIVYFDSDDGHLYAVVAGRNNSEPTTTNTPVPPPTPITTDTPANLSTPTATSTVTPPPTIILTPTPTATLLPPLSKPDISDIWGEVELFSLLKMLIENPSDVISTYEGKQITVRAPFIFRQNSIIGLAFQYAHDEALERTLSVACVIRTIGRKEAVTLARLDSLQESTPIVHVQGTIKFGAPDDTHYRDGGLFLALVFQDCTILFIGSEIQNPD